MSDESVRVSCNAEGSYGVGGGGSYPDRVGDVTITKRTGEALEGTVSFLLGGGKRAVLAFRTNTSNTLDDANICCLK